MLSIWRQFERRVRRPWFRAERGNAQLKRNTPSPGRSAHPDELAAAWGGFSSKPSVEPASWRRAQAPGALSRLVRGQCLATRKGGYTMLTNRDSLREVS
jgi:hypothetical protein